jgi:hypothetical protein
MDNLNPLRARSDHIGFTAIGIELAEDCEVGVAGVDSRIGIRPLGICLRRPAPLLSVPD